MALFRPKRGTSGVTRPASTLSIIASGMWVTGDIRCDGVVRIDGVLEGSILGARQLLVTPGGRVCGDVQADEIVVGGKIDGNVRASVRLELQGTAVVNGNIETRAFVVPEGGRVNGDIRMIGGDDLVRTEPLRLASPPAPPLSTTTPSEVPEVATPDEPTQEPIEEPITTWIDEPIQEPIDESPHEPIDEQVAEESEEATVVEQRGDKPERRLSKRERRRLTRGR